MAAAHLTPCSSDLARISGLGDQKVEVGIFSKPGTNIESWIPKVLGQAAVVVAHGPHRGKHQAKLEINFNVFEKSRKTGNL